MSTNKYLEDFSSSNYVECLGEKIGKTKQNGARSQMVRGLNRQAERPTMLTVASGALLLLLLVAESVLGFPRKKMPLRNDCVCLSLVAVVGSTCFPATFVHCVQRTRYQCQSPWALCTHIHQRSLPLRVRL